MKYTAVLSGLVAIASYAHAQEASAEDVATVAQQLENVVAAVTELDTGVRAFSGLADAASLQASSQAVIDALTEGAAAVEPVTGPITIIQASQALLDPVQRLNTIVETTVQGAIDAKQTFVDACVGVVILDQLTRQAAAADTFRGTIATKFAEADRGLVTDLSQPALDSLQRAIDAFADQTSTPASCGGGAEPTPEEPAPEEPAPEEPAPEEPAPETPAPEAPPPTESCPAPEPETPPPYVTDAPEPPSSGGDYTTTVTVGVCPAPVTVTVSECAAQTPPPSYGRYWRPAKGYSH